MSKKRPQKAKGGQALWWVAGIAVIAVAVLIGISLLSGKGEEPPQTVQANVKSDADLKAKGSVRGTGKVTLVEFGDYL